MPKTNIQRLDHMMQNEMDIQLAPLSNISNIEIKGGNGYVTFGVPPQVAQRLILGEEKHVGGFILADRDQFDSIPDE